MTNRDRYLVKAFVLKHFHKREVFVFTLILFWGQLTVFVRSYEVKTNENAISRKLFTNLLLETLNKTKKTNEV